MIAAPFRDWNRMIKSTINKIVTEPAVASVLMQSQHINLVNIQALISMRVMELSPLRKIMNCWKGHFNKWQLNCKT
jgi:hypothetical protein